MNKKQIIFPIEIKAVNHHRSYILQKAFTNDLNSVELVFKLTDCTTSDLTGATASILLFMRDGSFFQDIPTITGTDVKHTLTEAQGNHAGVAQAQLIVKSGTDEWASDKQKFEIIAGLETQVATEVMIKDWTMLTAEARAYLDDAQAAEAARAATFGQWADTQADWAADEAERVSAETSRSTAEGLRATAETGRVNAESARVTTEQGRVSAEAARVTAENNRQATIDAKVPKTTTVNGKALSANISVTAADVPNTPAGGIAATTVQAALNELDSEKANKTQEAWITPTLLNAWIEVSGYPVRYLRDEFGFVHLKGRVTSGTIGSTLFNLPVGYRPANTGNLFVVPTSFQASLILSINSAGAVAHSGGSLVTYIHLDGITFKAEG